MLGRFEIKLDRLNTKDDELISEYTEYLKLHREPDANGCFQGEDWDGAMRNLTVQAELESRGYKLDEDGHIINKKTE